MVTDSSPPAIAQMKPEQLPIPDHKLHGWTHFLGLYAGEHVAATEFVIGATFVALGATTKDILIGLLIGNVLAILSWTLITAPIAVQTRLSLYTYLHKIAGDSMTSLLTADATDHGRRLETGNSIDVAAESGAIYPNVPFASGCCRRQTSEMTRLPK